MREVATGQWAIELDDLMADDEAVRIVGASMPTKPGERPWVDLVDGSKSIPPHGVRMIFRDGMLIEVRLCQWRTEDHPVTAASLRAVRLGVLERRARAFLDVASLRAARAIGHDEVVRRTSANLARPAGRRGRSVADLLGVADVWAHRAGDRGAAKACAAELHVALPTFYEQLRAARKRGLLVDDGLTPLAERMLVAAVP